MPHFNGSFETTTTLPVSLEVARKHFSDLTVIVAQSADVQEARIEDDTIHFVLEEQDLHIAKFQGRYSCQYQVEGDTLRWNKVGDGNTDQTGEALFEVIDDASTQVTYKETLTIELDVPAMVQPMLQPVISAVVGKELEGFFERMVKAISA